MRRQSDAVELGSRTEILGRERSMIGALVAPLAVLVLDMVQVPLVKVMLFLTCLRCVSAVFIVTAQQRCSLELYTGMSGAVV